MRILMMLFLLAAHAVAHAQGAAANVKTARLTDLATDWQADPWIIAALLLVLAAYGAGIFQLWRDARKGRSSLIRQAAAFAGGWLALGMALLSPLATLGNHLFAAHMLQHELMIVGAAPLLVLGQPFMVAMCALPSSWRIRIAQGMRSRPTRMLFDFLAYPMAAWALYAVAFWVSLVPEAVGVALEDPLLRAAQQAILLACALLFWWSIAGDNVHRPDRAGAIMYLFTTMMHTSALGVLLACSAKTWYPAYAKAAATLGIAPLLDQQTGGMLVAEAGIVAYLLAGILLGKQWPARRPRTPVVPAATAAARAAGR